MLSALSLRLLNSLRRFMVPVKCPKCSHEFHPGRGLEFASWDEFLSNRTCPKCAQLFSIDDNDRSRFANPSGPFLQPRDSRIVVRATSERDREFDIPSGGHWGGLLPITILWNLFIPPAFFYFVGLGKWPVLVPQIFITVFFVVGICLLYGTFAVRFSTFRLSLGPEVIRLERSFLWKRRQSLPTREIDRVQRSLAYENVSEGNDEVTTRSPVYHLDLRARLRSFQFGASLDAADQHWLAWSIRDHIRRCGGTKLPQEIMAHDKPVPPPRE